MQIGWLRHQVTIKSVSTTRTTTSAPVMSVTTVATVWADVRTVSGSEQLAPELEQVQATTYFQVTIRYRAGLVPTMRLVWGTRTLEVVSVEEPDNRQRMLRLICYEVL